MRSQLPPQGRGAARDRVVVALGKEVPIFGGAGIKVDEFREKGGDVVRVKGVWIKTCERPS